MSWPILVLRYGGLGLLFAAAVAQRWELAVGGLILLAYSWIARWVQTKKR